MKNKTNKNVNNYMYMHLNIHSPTGFNQIQSYLVFIHNQPNASSQAALQ